MRREREGTDKIVSRVKNEVKMPPSEQTGVKKAGRPPGEGGRVTQEVKGLEDLAGVQSPPRRNQVCVVEPWRCRQNKRENGIRNHRPRGRPVA